MDERNILLVIFVTKLKREEKFECFYFTERGSKSGTYLFTKDFTSFFASS